MNPLIRKYICLTGKRKLFLLVFSWMFLVSSVGAQPAILSHFTGSVEVQSKGSKLWKKASPKMFLREGVKLRTGKRSKATLIFQDGSRTELYPNTIVDMLQLVSPISLKQLGGKTRNKVKKTGRGFSIKTPTAVCSVRGTEFDVGINKDGATKLDVLEGVVNGLKIATGESMDVKAGESLNFDKNNTALPAVVPSETKQSGGQDSILKALAKREVGLDMTREQIQAAAAEEMKLAEFQEGKSLIDVNGNRVRIEEYILRRPRDVAEVDRDKAFKFVVLNTREGRFDFFIYKGVFNKALPVDLSVALRNVSGRALGTEPEYYLTAYEMTQSNLTDGLKDMADSGHLVQITFDGTNYTLSAHGVAADGKAGAVTDVATQGGIANGKVYDPVADVYKTVGASVDGIYDPSDDSFKFMKAGDTLWRTVFNRYAHLMGPASLIAPLTLNDIPAGTLTAPWFQYYSQAAGITNVATLESINNAGLTSDGTINMQGRNLTLYNDQTIGHGSFRYLNGHYAFDSYFPDSSNPDVPTFAENIHQRLITYYPRNNQDVPFEQYDTYVFSDNGKIAPISAFANVTSGRAFKQELIKWNYEQQTRSSSFGDRAIDLVVEPKILIRSGLIK